MRTPRVKKCRFCKKYFDISAINKDKLCFKCRKSGDWVIPELFGGNFAD